MGWQRGVVVGVEARVAVAGKGILVDRTGVVGGGLQAAMERMHRKVTSRKKNLFILHLRQDNDFESH